VPAAVAVRSPLPEVLRVETHRLEDHPPVCVFVVVHADYSSCFPAPAVVLRYCPGLDSARRNAAGRTPAVIDEQVPHAQPRRRDNGLLKASLVTDDQRSPVRPRAYTQ